MFAAVAGAAPPAPTASFTYAPASPPPGQTVTFTSTSVDGDGKPIPAVNLVWDLDNDGQFDDDTGMYARRAFGSPGPITIRLRAVDDLGQEALASDVVVIGNQPPTASFTHRPEKPLAGETITLFSTSTDPDSPIETQSWDLDGDGSFDDASTAVASLILPLEGSYHVGLKVWDGEGSFAIAFETLIVGASHSAQGVRTGASLRILSPFPVVRIAGSVKKTGTRIRRFTVSAPVGAKATIRCAGPGCPFRRHTRTAVGRVRPEGQVPSAKVIRVRRLERRLLRVGVRIKVSITKPGVVGKFTEFRIRRRTVPARTDRCLEPGRARPVPCPAQ